MFRVKYKKEQILKGLRCFSIEIAILWTIILIDTLINTYYGKYSGIHFVTGCCKYTEGIYE